MRLVTLILPVIAFIFALTDIVFAATASTVENTTPIIQPEVLPAVSATPSQPGGRGGKIAKAILENIPWVWIVTNVIGATFQSGEDERAEFTKATIQELRNQSTYFNYIICSVGHKTNFYGENQTDWAMTKQELDLTWSKNVWYNIYAFRAGEFELTGEGGNANWYYDGNVTYQTADNRHFSFSNPTANEPTLTSTSAWITVETVTSGSRGVQVSMRLVAAIVTVGLFTLVAV